MTNKPRQTLALIDLAVDSGARKPRIESALNRLDGLTLLEWSIRRLGESTLVDSVVVTGPAKYRSILNQSRLCHAKWIPSVLTTPAQRAAGIADSQNADWVVHVNPMCPFMDPALVDRLIARGLSQAGSDFVGFVAPNSPNFSLHRLGLVAEMSSAKGLTKLITEGLASDPLDVPQLMRLHANQFRAHWIPLPAQLSSDSMKFLMETEEDWDRAGTYMEALGQDLSWQSLASVANRQKLA